MVDDQGEVPSLSFFLIAELQIQKHSFLVLQLNPHPSIPQVPYLHYRRQLQRTLRTMAGKESKSIIHELTFCGFVIYLIEVVILDM